MASTASATKSADNGSTRERLTEAAHQAVDQASEKAARIEDGVKSAAENMQSKARMAKTKAQKRGEELTTGLRGYVDERPLTALAIAFGAGIVISSLLRR